MTKYALIIAVDEEGGFSKENQIPWYFSEDFKHFRNVTTGHICVMGRKTYDDINARLGEKAFPNVLPDRFNIVLSNTLDPYDIKNATVYKTFEEVLIYTHNEQRTVFFIGGKSIFDKALELVDDIYITIVPGKYDCDLFFPLRVLKNFRIVLNTTNENGLQFIQATRK